MTEFWLIVLGLCNYTQWINAQAALLNLNLSWIPNGLGDYLSELSGIILSLTDHGVEFMPTMANDKTTAISPMNSQWVLRLCAGGKLLVKFVTPLVHGGLPWTPYRLFAMLYESILWAADRMDQYVSINSIALPPNRILCATIRMSLQSALIGFLISRLLPTPLTAQELIVVQTTAVATGTVRGSFLHPWSQFPDPILVLRCH